MKKSLLALLISSVFALSACNEKEVQALNEKLQQSEQTIAQLNQELAKSQQNFTAFKTENEQKLAELEKTKQAFPTLNVEIAPVFSKMETYKVPKSADEFRTEASVFYFISAAKTGYDWLDNLLMRQLWLSFREAPENEKTPPSANAVTGKEQAELLALLEKSYKDDVDMIKSEPISGFSNTLETYYIGQRDNILTFSISHYNYSGGAHGLYGTNYVLIDTNKKSVISLDDIMTKANQTKAKALLWQAYEREASVDENGKVETFTAKEDFEIVDNFYFDANGITFVYPPYALGSFAEGEKTLTLTWCEANKLLQADYQRSKKDGIGLAPENPLL